MVCQPNWVTAHAQDPFRTQMGLASHALLDLFSRTSDAGIAIDSPSRIVAWNPAATGLFGHAPEEVLGKYCAEVLRWRDRQGNLVCGPNCAIGKRAAQELAGQPQGVLATTRSGQGIWVRVSSLVLPRQYHRACQVVHFAREVTFTRRRKPPSGSSTTTRPAASCCGHSPPAITRSSTS